MADLEVSDEGGYWETGDRKALEASMQFINNKINWVSDELSSVEFGDMKGLTAEEIASRIAQHLQTRWNDDDLLSPDLG
jgi:broad specificity phosphatase PhoE